ncbi:MAG TPA: beta-ketoacyl synthase N-terminal-like domain-containing protein, partial [Labilithrix sp.]|nr:beta-ketoacyl synthase N-terminal-like domain-containing protein [Labilithrix sp.]
MNPRTTAASYSAIADQYDAPSNETSFWGELAREAYEGIVLLPRYRLVVDVGCGTGLALKHLRGRAPASTQLIGVEPAEQMRLLAQRRLTGDEGIEVRDGRFEELPLADASVDYLFSLWAFHWVSEPERAGAELRRVLKRDADLDLWFVGLNTGAEFARVTGDVLRRYVDGETRLRAASTMTSFDRDVVERVFSFFETSGLTVTEETATHYDSLERHWAWQVRSEAIYSVISPEERHRFDVELRAALAGLGDERGIPYTRHSFHVRYRHRERSFVALPSWLADRNALEDGARRPFLCTLTASTDDELRAAAEGLSSDLEREARTSSASTDIRAILDGATSGLGAHRAAVVALDTKAMASDLKKLAAGRVPPYGACGVVTRRPIVAFMFTGQGADLAEKGHELFETCPTFRAGLEQCAQHADESIGASLIDVMFRDTGRLADDTVNKVALFALQYSLAHLWRSWGVHPDVVVGHSLGEYAAACIAGALTLPDAIRLVIGRGRVMRDHASPGAMCAVQAGADRLGPFLVQHGGRIVVSAFNAAESVVLSGDKAALEEVSRELATHGIRTTFLPTAHAFHSPLMLPAVQPLREVCAGIAHHAPLIPFISTLEGGREVQALDAEYWVRHMLEPVRFTAALDMLERRGVSAYVEIGPGTTLTHLVAQRHSAGAGAGNKVAAHLPSLDGDRCWDRLLATLAVLHSQGCDIDWERFSPRASHRPLARPDRSADRRESALSAWGRRLSDVSPAEQLRVARRLILEEIAKLLGVQVGDIESHGGGLMDLGLRSVQLVALSRTLSAHLDQHVAETIAFSHPNVDRLARFVLDVLSIEHDEKPIAAPRHGSRDAAAPIAIVGAGCRLPGGVVDLAGLRDLLEAERDTVQPFPRHRARREAPSDSIAESSLPVSLLDDVADFDAAFFGISPREAARIDPTYRLLLEVCWEALEDAGIVPETLAGTNAGLFVGLGPSEFEARPEAPDADAHSGLGTMPSVGAGRISYVLGLRGPCLAVDTACSSSLVAIHLACQSLRAGECSVALAGGASLILSPATSAWLEDSHALATDGRCKTFSATADGYGRGEGCGVVVLKHLDQAMADGDRVLAVIRGSAINHDGASSGLTAPNGTAQEELLQRALDDAQCAPASVGYVEAHGTGTPLGDPIEVDALRSVYAREREDQPLLIGSVKTNLGHLEYAAGVAGLLKVIVALRSRRIPAHLHAEDLNPRISWEDGRVAVVRTSTDWPDWNLPRRAGVSSFGISGTNAHLIVEEGSQPNLDEGPPASTIELSRPQHGPLPFLLSAKSDAALRAQARRLRDHLAARPDLDIVDVAFSLATTRSQFEDRAAIVGHDPLELSAALDALALGEHHPNAIAPRRIADGKLAFLFTGQASQRPAMGRPLYDAFPVFREALDAVAARLDQALDRPLYDVLFAPEGSKDAALLDQTVFTQTALFALEVALFRLLESWGVKPDFLLG